MMQRGLLSLCGSARQAPRRVPDLSVDNAFAATYERVHNSAISSYNELDTSAQSSLL